jgi:nucleotide-binding universal stress UspA family protein
MHNQTETAPRWSIFHPTDFSPGSEAAFTHALKLALLAKAELSILHVTNTAEDLHWTDFPGVRHTLERWGILPAGSARSDVVEKGLYVKKVVSVHTDPARAIVHYLKEHPTNLIVLATHQREGIARWLHEAVAEPVVRQAKTMTLFVPHGVKGFVSLENGALTLQRIVIPSDTVPHPQPAINAACALAGALNCIAVSFTLVHIGEKADMPAVQVPEQEGWKWETIVQRGDVVEQILHFEAERSADLMAMTTQGHLGFLDVLRGSTTERVLRGARCPLLAIPAWGH